MKKYSFQAAFTAIQQRRSASHHDASCGDGGGSPTHAGFVDLWCHEAGRQRGFSPNLCSNGQRMLQMSEGRVCCRGSLASYFLFPPSTNPCSLTYRMKIEVQTGQTKAKAGILLLPIVLGEENGERVFLLLHCEGKEQGIDHLRTECVGVLTHAIIEGEGGGYQRLESALKELNGLLKGFLLSDAVRDVHAVIGLLEQDGNIHMSHVGRAEAYVIRGGTAIQVTEYERGRPPAAFMHIVSGPIEDRDQFIVSTQRLLRTLTPAQLVDIVRHSGINAVQTIISKLSSEKEVACLLHIAIESATQSIAPKKKGDRQAEKQLPPRNAIHITDLISTMMRRMQSSDLLQKIAMKGASVGMKKRRASIRERVTSFLGDLYHPERKRRAHLLLLAGAAGLFVVIWTVIQLTVLSQRSQTKNQLKELVTQISEDLASAESHRIAGDTDSANKVLSRAEDRAHQVKMNETGLFRTEASALLEKIVAKREEMNRIVRVVPPRVMAALSAKKSDIVAQGFIGSPNGEFLVYDRQDLYKVLLNTVERGEGLGSKELILDAASFPRFQSNVFMTTGNSILEQQNGQVVSMKTEDAAGWINGNDIETYLRYLYVLSPERKQIFKYERLSDKYGVPVEYNSTGDLSGALDMTIQGPVYVLRNTTVAGGQTDEREVLKLLRGQKQAFSIRNLPPKGLANVAKIFKSGPSGNLYFLDPKGKRIIVTTDDGDIGESLYLKQYILDSDEVGLLKDFYVDPKDSRLYVLDEKRLYAIDMDTR